MRFMTFRLGLAAILLLVTPLLVFAARNAFGFNASNVSGLSGSVQITGGGAYALPEFVNSAGGFRCTDNVTSGRLAGCLAGEGVRWDTAALLTSTNFKCTPTDSVKTATTGDHKVVLQADFYRAGDGIDESFTAKMIVSDSDLAPTLPGDQNVWIEGVGCGAAVVSFN